MTNDATYPKFHKLTQDRYVFLYQQPVKRSKNEMNLKHKEALAVTVPFLFLFLFPDIVLFLVASSLCASPCPETKKNNLLLVTAAEWILLLIVEVNTLFEYEQSPVIKGPLRFMKYSSKVSPGDSHAFRCTSQNPKQTSTDKRLQAATASFWTMRQTGTRWVTSRVDTSPCRSAGFQPFHLLINQQEHTLGSSS